MISTFLKIFVCLTYFCIILTSNSLLFQPPNIQQTFSIPTPIIQFGIVTKLKANQLYIIRLSLEGKINIFSRQNYESIATLRAETGLFNLVSKPFIDFSLSQINSQIIIILTQSSYILYDIRSNSLLNNVTNSNILYKWYKIALTKNHVIIFSYYLFNRRIYRYDSRTNNLMDYINLSLDTFMNFQICQSHSHGQVFAIWNLLNQIQVYQCLPNQQCQKLFQNPDIPFILNQNRAKFSSNCDYIYDQVSTFQNASMITLSNHKHQTFFNYSIFSFFGVDDQDFFSIFVLTNNSILFYENSPLNNSSPKFIKQYNLSFHLQANYFTSIGQFNNEIFICMNSFIKILRYKCPALSYMISKNLCAQCSETCSQCDNTNGKCTQCINDSYLLQTDGRCIQISINQTENTIQQKEKQFIRMISQTLQITTNIVMYILMLLQVSPFSFLFLNFINYWSTISIYVLLDIEIPFYLKSSLKMVFDIINKSIFDMIGNFIQIKDIFSLVADQNIFVQKTPSFYAQEYGISSKFISYNFQQFIQLSFCYLIIMGIYAYNIYYELPKKSWLYQKIQPNFLYVVLYQMSASIFCYCIVFFVIFQKSYQNNFSQKINMLFTVIAIGFSICLPILILSSFQQHFQKKYYQSSQINLNAENLTFKSQLRQLQCNQFRKTKQKVSDLYSQKIQILYLVLCKIILPIFISLSITQPNFQIFYFLFSFILFCFGLYSAHIKKEYRLNYLIFNCYFLIFHIGFFIIWMIQKNKIKQNVIQQQIISICSYVCLMILIIGTIHEILFFLYEIIYYFIELFRQFRLSKCRVCNNFHKNQQSKQKNELIQNNDKNLNQHSIEQRQQQNNNIKKILKFKKIKNSLLIQKWQIKTNKNIELNQNIYDQIDHNKLSINSQKQPNKKLTLFQIY